MQNLESLLKQSDELPSLPEIYMKVSELLESENSTAYQIGEAVQTDPSLTARILKMINSAYYGLSTQVTSIPQAVTLLGRHQLQQILTGSILAGVFSNIDIVDYPIREFWQHSIKTAIIARHLAMQNVNVIDHEAFFTAGLLHDIGKLVIAKVAPVTLVEIEEQVKDEAIDVLQLEAEKLGVTHIEVAAALMHKWRLPSLLAQCVIRHHEVDHVGPFAIDTSIVYLANLLSQHDLAEDNEEMQKILSTIPNWQTTENSHEQILIACQLADEQWLEVMESLGMVDMEIYDDFF